MSKDFLTYDEAAMLEAQDSAPDFIPYDAVPEEPQDKTSAGMAALEHFGNAATLGYLPHLQAVVEQMLPNPTAEADEQLRAQGINVPRGQNYLEARDENIKRLELEGKEHPIASGAGTLGGIVGGGALTGAAGVAAKGANAAQRLKSAIQAGAILGAAQNPGDIEGEFNPLQTDARLKNAGVGAATGGVAQGLVEGVPLLAKSASKYLKGKAEERAFKALGPDLRAVRQNYDKGKIQEIGRTALDEGIVGSPTSYEGIAKRAQAAKEAAGGELQNVLEDLEGSYQKLVSSEPGIVPAGTRPPGAQGGVDRKAIAQAMREELLSPHTDISGVTARNAKIEKLIQEFENGGDSFLGLMDAEMKKRATGKLIKWDRLPGTEIPLEEEVQRALYSKLRQGVEDSAEAMDKLVNGPSASRFIDAKKRVGNLDEMVNIATKRDNREFANRFLSPTDYLTGTAGAIAGAASGDSLEEKAKNAMLGASLGLANKFARTQGNQIIAKGMDQASRLAQLPGKLGDLIRSNPQMAEILGRSSPAFANKAGIATPFIESSGAPLFQNPRIMEMFEKNPGLADSIQDEKLRAQVKERLRSVSGNRAPSSEPPVSEDEARKRFIQGN